MSTAKMAIRVAGGNAGKGAAVHAEYKKQVATGRKTDLAPSKYTYAADGKAASKQYRKDRMKRALAIVNAGEKSRAEASASTYDKL